jgi:hypothetical protein
MVPSKQPVEFEAIGTIQSKRILIQYAVGEYHERMLRTTRASHAAYCEHWSIDYHYCDKVIPTGKEPHWRKVTLMRDALHRGFDRVLWLDADTVIMDHRIDLFANCGYGISCCECPANAIDPTHYNSGVVFLQHLPEVEEFVCIWDESPDKYDGWRDQGVFNRLLAEPRFKEILTVLPHRFNSVPQSMPATQPLICAAHGQPPDRVKLMSDWLALVVR